MHPSNLAERELMTFDDVLYEMLVGLMVHTINGWLLFDWNRINNSLFNLIESILFSFD